tara:strand:- start:19931 stop:20779 length:849 start_codon:yes stop_codon:yes gene_type:complete
MRALSSQTYVGSPGQSLRELLTSSQADFPASHFPWQDKEKPQKMTGTCGPTSQTASDKPNPNWSSLKMFRGLRQPHPQGSTAFCTMSCQTWKDWATNQRQDSSQRQKLGHPTNANGGSSSVFATPTATANQMAPSMQKNPGCANLNWPTPDVTQRPHKGNVRLLRKGVEQGMSKAEADAMLGRDISKPQGKLEIWRTPVAKQTQKKLEMLEEIKTTGAFHHKTTGKEVQIGLGEQVHMVEVIHSGQCHQDQSNMDGSHHGQLNPDWVETLMGYPIGWTDSER